MRIVASRGYYKCTRRSNDLRRIRRSFRAKVCTCRMVVSRSRDQFVETRLLATQGISCVCDWARVDLVSEVISIVEDEVAESFIWASWEEALARP